MNMKIGPRILLGYGAALVVVAAVGIVAYRASNELVQSADWVTHSHQVKESLAQVLAALTDAETGQRGFVLTGEERYLDPYKSGIAVVDDRMRTLRELTADNPVEQMRIERLQTAATSKLAELQHVIELRRQNGERAALAEVLTDKGKKDMEEIRRVVGDMNEEENALLRDRDRTVKATARYATASMLFGGALVVFLVVAIGLLTQRSITLPLSQFMQFVGRVGDGDLTHEAKISSRDELGELAQCLDQMVSGLKNVAGQTRMATENLNAAAAEILASTQQQAAGTGEQAAAIQQTTTTMEEVTQSGVADFAAGKAGGGIRRGDVRGQPDRSAGGRKYQPHHGDDSRTGRSGGRKRRIAERENAGDRGDHLDGQRSCRAISPAGAECGDRSRSRGRTRTELLGDRERSEESGGSVARGHSAGAVDPWRHPKGHQQLRHVDGRSRQEGGIRQTAGGRGGPDDSRDDRQHPAERSGVPADCRRANQQQIGFTQVMQAIRDIGQASQQTASSTRQLEKAAVNLTALAQQLQKAVERYRI